jgi:hypothetical protein
VIATIKLILRSGVVVSLGYTTKFLWNEKAFEKGQGDLNMTRHMMLERRTTVIASFLSRQREAVESVEDGTR